MTELRLILGDQLSPRHSWFDAAAPDTVYVLMEVRQETDYVRHHAQKIIAIFAAMRDFAARLRAEGHLVDYIAIDDPHGKPFCYSRFTHTRFSYQYGIVF